MTNSEQVAAFQHFLRDRGFVTSTQAVLTPLTGGVSSEICLVEDGDRRFVVKRALKQLKVEADWFADPSRNCFEQAYIRYVGGFRPDAMPALLQCDAELHAFSMEYLDGFQNWKEDLLAGVCDPRLASRAGALLGEIHARSWGDPRVEAEFDSMANFDQLRIDPYLRASAAKHPQLSSILLAEADRLLESRQCLVHGDYSPKNMLHKNGRLVALDCEVACYADAAFDLAFFLNHLFLKCLFHAPQKMEIDELVVAARNGYRAHNPTHAAAVEGQAARLLPMLMLARVDGKSPVEYLTGENQDVVRGFVEDVLCSDCNGLSHLEKRWFETISSLGIS